MKFTTDEEIKELVNIEHFLKGKSLRRVEREKGLSNDTLRKRCLKLGIKTRGRRESIIADTKYIVKPSGDSHWTKTHPEKGAKFSKLSSDRMTKNNPAHMEGIPEKMAQTKSETYRDNPTFHEKLFSEELDALGIKYVSQFVVGSYIADFLIDGVLIELDGRGHRSRHDTDLTRDKFLCSRGFHVMRIPQRSLFDKRAKEPSYDSSKSLTVLKQYITDDNILRRLPSSHSRKHRVIVREADTCAEIVY